jgi:two-component sensor histidine kinase
LLSSESWDRASISQVVERSLAPFQDPHRQRFTISGDHAWVSATHSLTLAMALHELATNAAKYGALSTATGNVRLSWCREGAIITLSWIERGGPPMASRSHRGFGSVLIEQSFDSARIDFAPHGVTCELKIPSDE